MPARPDVPARAAVALVGAGALGTALGRRLHACGFPLDVVVSRTTAAAQRLADATGSRASADLSDVASASVVFLCVPDGELPRLAQTMGSMKVSWEGLLVAHTSGALGLDVLAPLQAQGAQVLGFHPVQAFARDTPPEAFAGIFVGLEGEGMALERGKHLAEALGARWLALDAAQKPLYHLALALVSNFTVTLLALSTEVLRGVGMDTISALSLVRPLLEGTIHNSARQLPERALTGPIARGDVETVARHLDALRERLPHLVPTYAALATETVRVAVRGGRLSPEQAGQLLDALQGAVDPGMFPEEDHP